MKTRNVRGLGAMALACAGLLLLSGCTKKSTSSAPPPGTKGGKMPGIPVAAPVTTAAISAEISSYVSANAPTGKWTTTDPTNGQTVELTWVSTHEEMLMKTGPNSYVQCADFTAADGTKYDVDFMLTGTNAEDLTVTSTEIHQVADVPRYTWTDVDGTYQKQPAGTTQPG